MRVCGVICEYNPFHKGHALHLQRARALSGADYVVCAMSGPFTQRGTPARHDKWLRARMALLGGADLVLELPARFACAPAPDFARGGVELLQKLGVTTHLSFGCEQEALPALHAAKAVFQNETPDFQELLREKLALGLPFPRARAEAAEIISGMPDLAEIISRPNAVLALEYLQALPENIEVVPVVREGSGYHDTALSSLSSATAIRAALEQGHVQEALDAVPFPHLLKAAEESRAVHAPEALTAALLYRLRTAGSEALSGICGMDEGLEHRFLDAARAAGSREELLALVKTKRYTHARLSRLATLSLLGVTRDFARANQSPTYARVLGFKKSAAPLLAAIKENGTIPLVTKAARFDADDPLFALDLRAQDIWALGCGNADERKAGRDFRQSPVIIG